MFSFLKPDFPLQISNCTGSHNLVGDELNELGYNHMFMDMFFSLEEGREPKETFYDGYVVNSILDAAYLSAKSYKFPFFNSSTAKFAARAAKAI